MMEKSSRVMGNRSGFTLIEVLVVSVVMVALASVAIPTFIVWMPNYRLRTAAREVYSTFQLAKLSAIRSNGDYAVKFYAAAPLKYELIGGGPDKSYGTPGDNVTEKTVSLFDYDDKGNIVWGKGNATKQATTAGPAFTGDYITHAAPVDVATFNSRGLGNDGYVYITNERGSVFAIGTHSTGRIVMFEWRDGDWR